MTAPKQTTREFWIEFEGNPENDKYLERRYVGVEKFNAADFNHEIVHVIEKSAYDELKKQAEVLVEQAKKYLSTKTSADDANDPDRYAFAMAVAEWAEVTK